MSIKAICDDGFQSLVMYGPDSTVDDVYNHVLAVRMSSEGPKRYAAKIRSNEQATTQQHAKGKNKGNNNNNNNKNGSFVYVLPSMKISAIFPQSNGSSLELFLDGFRNVDNTATVIRDLRVLSSTIREIDSAVQNTISLYENGSLTNPQALESVRDNVRFALVGVQDCMPHVVATGLGNDRKRTGVESIGNALSPVANKKLKLNDASAVPVFTASEKKAANTPAKADNKQAQQQKPPQQQQPQHQKKIEGNQSDKAAHGKAKEAASTQSSQVSNNTSNNNKANNQKKDAPATAISDAEASQPNAKKAKTISVSSDAKAATGNVIASPISSPVAEKGKGKAAKKVAPPAPSAVNASVFTDSETETAPKPTNATAAAPTKGAANAKKAATAAPAANEQKKTGTGANKLPATAPVTATEGTEKPAAPAKKTLNAPVVSAVVAAKAAVKKPATAATKRPLSSASSSSGSDSDSSSGSDSDSDSDSGSASSSSSDSATTPRNKQLLTEKGKLTLKARKQLQKQKQQAENNTKIAPPAKATKKPVTAATKKVAAKQSAESGSESDSESDSGSSDSESDSDATFASAAAKKTVPQANATKPETPKKTPVKAATANTKNKTAAAAAKIVVTNLVDTDSEHEQKKTETSKPETKKADATPVKAATKPLPTPAKTNTKKLPEKIDANEPLDLSQTQSEPDSQATTASAIPTEQQPAAAAAAVSVPVAPTPKGVTTRVTRARVAQQVEPESVPAVIPAAEESAPAVSETKPAHPPATNTTHNQAKPKTPVAAHKPTPVYSSDSSSSSSDNDDSDNDSDSSSTVVQTTKRKSNAANPVTPAAKNKLNGSFVSARDRIASSDSDSDHSTPIAPRQRPLSQVNGSQPTQDTNATAAASAPLPAALQKLLVDSTVSFKPPSHFLPAHIIQQQQQQQRMTAPHSVTKHLLLTQSQSVLSTSSSDNSDNDDHKDNKNKTVSQNSTDGQQHKSPAYWAAMAQSTPSKFVDEVLNGDKPLSVGTIVPPMSASKSALGLDKLNRSQHTVSGTKSVSTSDNETMHEEDVQSSSQQPHANASASLIKNLIENSLSSEELRVEQLKHQSQIKKKGASSSNKTQQNTSQGVTSRPLRSTATTAMSQESAVSSNNGNKNTATNKRKRND